MGEMTERERWAEAEAAQCEKVAAGIEECIAGWLAGARHHSSFLGAYEAALTAKVWRDVARSLRQPFYARQELEACDALTTTPARSEERRAGE